MERPAKVTADSISVTSKAATARTKRTPTAATGGRPSRSPQPRPRRQSDISLTEQAYKALEEMITTLVLPPGSVLGEQSLSQRLGIGRTPLREALQRLARDGLVVVLPRRGILVSEIDIRRQLRLLETRRVLEQLIARLAAERATADERAAFRRIAADMRTAAASADDIAFMRLDHQFNELASTASRNEFATGSLQTMSGLSRRFWYQHSQQVADLPLTANLHADVCEAIAARDSKAASTASDRLIDYIETFARRTLDT